MARISRTSKPQGLPSFWRRSGKSCSQADTNRRRTARLKYRKTTARSERSRFLVSATVWDADLSKFFDTIRHSILLDKIAKRVQDPEVMHLVKQIIKVTGKVGVPQGSPFSPLAANIYLNEIDWMFEAIRQKTTQGPYEAVNYDRFSDDIVITISGHHTKRGWAERALQRLEEALTPLGVSLN